MSTDFFDITPSPRLLEVLGDIPLAPWQCVAELVDNSFDDFIGASASGDEVDPRVEVRLPTNSADRTLIVRDHGRGMTESAFETSLKAGYSGRGRYGTLGLFGMGFNIATARLGLRTTVRTTQPGTDHWTSVTIDFRELQREETFRVPVVAEPKDEPAEGGTEITVTLKPDIAEDLCRKAARAALGEKLGEVYSYLLREGVPGLNDTELSGNAGFTLLVNGQAVAPILPCIWAQDRSVHSHGQPVSAVAKLNVVLSEAWACQICGAWDRSPEPEECPDCGAPNMEKRARRIYGWLGVQRYIDTNRFGIDFLRHGRKILLQDKGIFTYEDPDTGARDIEYPIEMPANRGRLVGEIHLDHVRVTYQKNDFDRSSQDWYTAIQQIRGHQPMKPRKRGENTTPLGVLYSAFRRNDPGLRYLTPGDGEKALHDKGRQWADQFYAGVAAYQSDTVWYENAEKHQRIKDGDADSDDTPDDSSAIDKLLGGEDGPPEPPKPSHEETEDERFLRYRAKAVERQDLSGPVTLAGGTPWSLTVFVTRETLEDEDKRRQVALSRLPEGNQLEVYVDSLHPVFTECGRDVRDFAVMEAAFRISQHIAAGAPDPTEATAELLLALPDQRMSEPLLRERVETVLNRVRETAEPIFVADPDAFWSALSADDKEVAEEAAAAGAGQIDWEAAVADGSFVWHLGASGFASLVRHEPGSFLDGEVFLPAWKHWKSEDARYRSVEKVARSLDILHEFLADPGHKGPADLTVVRVLAEQLIDQLKSDETA